MKLKDLISKSEQKYLALIVVFVATMFYLFKFTNFETYVDGLSPILQFLTVNLGVFFILVVLFKSIASNKKQGWQGALSIMCLFIATDLWMPEFHLTTAGELIKGGIFGASASDYFFGYIYHSIGITGPMLWVMVYVVTTIVLYILSALLLKDFVKHV